MTASLTLTYGALNLTASPYLIEFGTDLGAPANEALALAFLLQDGEVELSSRAGNRTIQFNVLIEGASLSAMATAEAALIAETEKVLNTLTVDPGDGAPASVYEIFRGQVSLLRDDDFELSRLRRYTVTVRALPFTRSVAETVTAALPASGSTTTVLDAMGATTGWTGFVNGGAATVTNTTGPPSTNSVSSTSGTGTFLLALQKTFAATTSATKLLMTDWKVPNAAVGGSLVVTGDGVTLPLVAEQASPTSGYVRSFHYVAASSLAVTRFEYSSGPTAPASVRTLLLDNVSVTNDSTLIGAGRQQMRSLTVTGSARAPGALTVQSSTAALGNGVLIYTSPVATANGYSPNCRQFRSSGNTVTSDSAMVSGSREPATGSGIGFLIPFNLVPQGNFVAIARMGLPSGSGSGTVTLSMGTSIGGLLTTGVTLTSTQSLTTTYANVVLGRVILPTTDVPLVTTASVSLNLNTTGWASLTPTLDELWLFNTSTGQLIAVNCGTGSGSSGGAARRLFIDPPNPTTPRPTILMGHAADRSDAYYPMSPNGSVVSWQAPVFAPPQVNVFIVTPNVTDATVSLSYYARWHTNAAS